MATLLTMQQRKLIANVVKLRHAALLIELLGDNAVPASLLAQVKAKGFYKRPRPEIVQRAFNHGRETVLSPKIAKMTPKQFEAYLGSKKLAFTPEEKEAVVTLRRSFKEYLKKLASEYVSKLNTILIKNEKGLQRALMNKQADIEVERRLAIAQTAADLKQITIEQLGNADRVVETETNNAWQDGRAKKILESSRKSGIDDPMVFKRPRSDACEACKAAYLKSDGVTPKLFKLSELIANGSNVGRKRPQRKATLDSQHPFCSCLTHWLAPGFAFDKRGEMTYVGTKR